MFEKAIEKIIDISKLIGKVYIFEFILAVIFTGIALNSRRENVVCLPNLTDNEFVILVSSINFVVIVGGVWLFKKCWSFIKQCHEQKLEFDNHIECLRNFIMHRLSDYDKKILYDFITNGNKTHRIRMYGGGHICPEKDLDKENGKFDTSSLHELSISETVTYTLSTH